MRADAGDVAERDRAGVGAARYWRIAVDRQRPSPIFLEAVADRDRDEDALRADVDHVLDARCRAGRSARIAPRDRTARKVRPPRWAMA